MRGSLLFIQPVLISDQGEKIRNCVYLLPVEQPELCYFNYKVVVCLLLDYSILRMVIV